MKGFTQIELIIVSFALLLLTGLGVSSYNNFNERQKLRQAALTLRTDIRDAQNKSIVGDKNRSECATLLGYSLQFNSSTSYRIQASCLDTSGSTVDYPDRAVNLPAGIYFNPIPSQTIVTFNVLPQGVNLDSDLTIILKSDSLNKAYTLVLTTGGAVIDVGY